MSKEEKGNFCQSCQKTVIDFSHMSDEDIIRTIKNTKGSICGRFNNKQLNRPMYFSYSTNVQRPYSVKTILAGIVALTLIQPLSAKASILPVQSSFVQPVSYDHVILPGDSVIAIPDLLNGRIIDENLGMPITVAQVYIEGSKDTARVDDDGRFILAIPEQLIGKSFTIEVIVGRKTKSYFLVTPEELASAREMVFVMSREKYVIDGMIIYTEDPPSESNIIKHQEIRTTKKGKKK